MDLLGRKARAELERNKVLLYETQNLARSQALLITDLSARLHSRESELYQLYDLAGRIAERLPEPEQPVQKSRVAAHRPIHMSEEEQELQWQLDNGYINASDYENILKELDFQNAEIALDPDYRPRPDLTY